MDHHRGYGEIQAGIYSENRSHAIFDKISATRPRRIGVLAWPLNGVLCPAHGQNGRSWSGGGGPVLYSGNNSLKLNAVKY